MVRLRQTGLAKYLLLCCLLSWSLLIGCQTGSPIEGLTKDAHRCQDAFLKGQWDEVVIYGSKWSEADGDDVVPHFLLSVAYYMKGKYAIQQQERSLAFWSKPSIDVILTWCKEFAEKNSNNHFAHLLLGSAYLTIDQVDDAVRSYKRATELNPRFADAYVGLGAAHLSEGRIDDGIESFEKALEVNPRHAAAYYNLGFAYDVVDRTDDAIACYKKAIEIDPTFADAHLDLGILYLDDGDKHLALEALKKAREIDPSGMVGQAAQEAIQEIETNSDNLGD